MQSLWGKPSRNIDTGRIEILMPCSLDGFALNIGDYTQPYVTNTLSYLFNYAAGKSFKLFISMDVAAAASACTASGTSCDGVSPSHHWQNASMTESILLHCSRRDTTISSTYISVTRHIIWGLMASL